MAVLVVSSVLVAWAAPSGAGTSRVSAVSRTGKTFSFRPWLSANGRFVAFDSDADTAVAGDTNGVRDVLVYDRATGATDRVSVASDGTEANGPSQRPTISADGQHVAFWSSADNLVAEDTNGVADAFVHDRASGRTVRVSVASDGTQGNGESARPVISGDGRLVAFESAATNLIPRSPIDQEVLAGLLPGGRDPDPARNVFVHNLETGETAQVSLRSDGSQGDGDSLRPSISDDGRLVAFHSASALVPEDTNDARDVYVHDLTSGEITRVSVSGEGQQAEQGGSFSPSLSAEGRFVAFWSNASDLVPGDTNGAADIFVHDRQTSQTTRVSVAADGTQGDADSYSPNLGADGTAVAFDSLATTLVPHDPHRGSGIYLHVTPLAGPPPHPGRVVGTSPLLAGTSTASPTSTRTRPLRRRIHIEPASKTQTAARHRGGRPGPRRDLRPRGRRPHICLKHEVLSRQESQA